MEKILEEFRIILSAPRSFGVVVLAAISVIWIAIEWGYGSIISNKDSEIVLLKAQRDDYRDKLGGSSPDQAKARIDKLEAQLKTLREQTEPRHLTPEQRQAITSVSRVPNGVSYALLVSHEGGCPDCPQYGADFENVFRIAGWTVTNAIVMGVARRPIHGIALMVPDQTKPSADVDLLQRAFRSARIEFDLVQVPQLQMGSPDGRSIQLLITAKPVP